MAGTRTPFGTTGCRSGRVGHPRALQCLEPPVNSETPQSSLPPPPSRSPESPRQVFRRLKWLWTDIEDVLALPDACAGDARTACRAERDRAVSAQLAVTPVRELKRFSRGRINFRALEDAGIRTVGAVSSLSEYHLEAIRGIGPKSSARILVAAKRLGKDARSGHTVRFDIEHRPGEQSQLLYALRALDQARRSVRPLRPRLEAAKHRIDADFVAVRVAAKWFLRMFAGKQKKERADAALERMARFLNEPETAALESEIDDIWTRLEMPRGGPAAIWDEYAARAAAYNSLLSEIEELELGPGRQRGARSRFAANPQSSSAKSKLVALA